MDYYYALLDSYALLKKRKFKLSLSEKKEDSKEAELASQMGTVQSDIKAAFDAGGNQTGLGNGGNINMESSQDEKGNQVVKISGSNIGAKNVSDFGELNFDNEEEFGYKLAAAWLGDFGGEAQVLSQDPDKEEVDPLQDKLDALAEDTLSKIETLGGLDERFAPDQVEQLNELVNASLTNIPGAAEQKIRALEALGDFLTINTEIAQNPDLARDGKFVEKINTFINDNGISITQYGVVFRGSYFETDFMVEGDKPLEEAIADLNALQERNKEELGIGSSAEEIPKPSKKETGWRNQWRGGAAEFMAEATPHLATWLDSEDEGEREEAFTELMEIMEKSQGEVQRTDLDGNDLWLTPDGGTTTDKKEADYEKEENNDPKIDPKGGKIYIPAMEVALDVPTLVTVFEVGMGGRAGTLLIGDEDGIDDLVAINWLRKKFIDAGVSEEVIDERLQEIASGDNPLGGLQAVILILAVNRDFEEEYMGKLKAASTRAVGGGAEIEGQTEQMSDQGAKADMIDTFCENPDTKEPYTKDEIVAHFDSLLSDDQRTHYATGCDGGKNPFAGAKALVREVPVDSENPDGPKCLDVDRELKVFTDHGSNTKHKVGQQSNDTVDSVCAPDRIAAKKKVDKNHAPGGKYAMTDTSKKFVDNTKQRLVDCGFPDAFKNMCKFDDELETAMKNYDTMFSFTAKVHDPQKMRGGIEEWFKAKVGDDDDKLTPETKASKSYKKAKKKQEAALAATTQGKQPHPYPQWVLDEVVGDTTKAQELCKKQVKSIRGNLKGAAMVESLRREANSTKKNLGKGPKGKLDGRVLTGEGLDYMMARYAIACGSDRECVKQKRHLEEDSQSISFNNAEMAANLAALKNGLLPKKERGKDEKGNPLPVGRIRHGSGAGTQFYLEVQNPDTEEWEIRAQGDSYMGTVTWMSDHDVSHDISAMRQEEARKKSEAIETLGASFHKNWAEEFRKENPQDQDRFRPTTDEAWAEGNEPEGGWGEEGPQVDILNTEFGDLPEDWKAENTGAAKEAVDIVERSKTEEEAAEAVHKAWIKRNDWNEKLKEKQPELFLLYAELSQREKDKDLDQVKATAKMLGKKFEESEESPQEDLFIAFLKGQKSLLEKLMNQTT